MSEQSAGCVLFADVSGSTKLYEVVGDAAAHAAIDLCVKLFANITQEHGGRVIKTIGDEVMSIFPDAASAGRAATDIQLGIASMPPVDKVRLGVRIGLHYGPVVERDGDVFGDTVNLSARLTEMAARGQIITSFETVERLGDLQRLDCRKLYAIPVKGKEKDVQICEILWTDVDDATQLAAPRTRNEKASMVLRVSYRERQIVLPNDRKTLVMGRDATADLVVAERMASRMHCELEARQGRFFLTDRSANGTWLSIDGAAEVVLRREESMLHGHGFISLGQPRTSSTELVEFTCE
jgi:adenylate cyclase